MKTKVKPLQPHPCPGNELKALKKEQQQNEPLLNDDELKEDGYFTERITHIASCLVGVTDLIENKFIFVNKAVTDLFGYTSEEIKKMDNGKWMDLVHPDDLHILRQLFADAVVNDGTQEATYRVKRKDGTFGWLHNRTSVFKKDPRGRPVQLFCIAFDVTNNKKEEICFRENKILFEAIFNSSPSGIEVFKAVRNKRGEIIDFEYMLVNKAAEKHLGRSDLTGQKLAEEYPAIKDTGLFDLYKRVVDHNEFFDIEHYQEKNGERAWFHRVGIRMNDGLIVTWEDISERKKMHEEHTNLMLKKQKEQAQAVFIAQEQERKRIAEALHNELGQLLYITKLKVADNSIQEADRLLETAIEHVRNLSFELMPTILHDFGLEIALKDLARKKLAASDIRYSLRLTALKKRPALSVEISVFRMVQELLNNVVKHAKANYVSIEVIKAGKNIAITVKDNGRGFTRQLQEKSKGFGLGNIENRIKLLNGTVTIDTAPGSGTKVCIVMPSRAPRTH